jgi:hypothetical protein
MSVELTSRYQSTPQATPLVVQLIKAVDVLADSMETKHGLLTVGAKAMHEVLHLRRAWNDQRTL